MAADSFYGVRGGPRPGVYRSWDVANEFTTGHKGALCKKFKTEAEALAFVGPTARAQPGPGAAASVQAGLDATRHAQAQAGPDSTAPSQAEPGVILPVREGPVATAHTQAVPGARASNDEAHSAGRVYLKVPFAQKDEAKALGAKWDPDCKKWFAPSQAAVPALSRWLPVEPQGGRAASAPCRTRAGGAKTPAPFLTAAERKALAAPKDDELALYTDGACKGNRNVASKKNAAGWGVAVVGGGGAHGCHAKRTESLVEQLFGPVVLEPTSKFFLGAEVGSNNTGELSGICEGLLWLRDHDRSTRPAAIFYDSVYAAKITTKEFRAEKNKELAKCAQDLLAQVRQGRDVRLEHVKGHSNDRWNDLADTLANRGASGQTCSVGRYRTRLIDELPDDPAASVQVKRARLAP